MSSPREREKDEPGGLHCILEQIAAAAAGGAGARGGTADGTERDRIAQRGGRLRGAFAGNAGAAAGGYLFGHWPGNYPVPAAGAGYVPFFRVVYSTRRGF